VKARCCVKLGRWRQAREALESVGLVEGDNDKGEYGGDLGGLSCELLEFFFFHPDRLPQHTQLRVLCQAFRQCNVKQE